MDIMMSGCVPPLELLLRLVVSVHQWLNKATRHVVVVHGADDPETTAGKYGAGALPVVLFFACYLSWVGKADHPKEAMLEVSRRMGMAQPLRPSQLRYLSASEGHRRRPEAMFDGSEAISSCCSGGSSTFGLIRHAWREWNLDGRR